MTNTSPLLSRRRFLQSAALATGALALGPSFWREAVASPATPGPGPYGPLGDPDANGLRLPEGFRSRLVARGNQAVPGTSYRFPAAADGQATFATPDGGWILVTNSETADGGASAVRFTARGEVADAYRILSGTRMNCAGGPTPWGTWLSCEEEADGWVWECDPTRASQGVRRPALGCFKHEAVCVDSVGQRVYLTEDAGDGCFYRFTPTDYPSLDAGVLEVALVASDGRVTWRAVSDPLYEGGTAAKDQVPEATRFKRGEGTWFDSGVVYVATTTDGRIHAYDTRTERLEVIYDAATVADAPLRDVDNICVAPSGDLYACEDPPDDQIDIALLTPEREVSRFAQLVGEQHAGSEATGPVFDPSGTRLYFTSQTGLGGDGAVYEVTGPFRGTAPGAAPPSAPPREPGQAVLSGQAATPAAAAVPLALPALGVELPRRMRLATALRRGIPVRLTLDEPARILASARLGRRRVGRKRVAVTRSGPVTVHVRVRRADLLRRRGRIRLAVKLSLWSASGTRTDLVRTVVLERGRRR
jgi:secreted PhoX family phosphatase